MVILELLPDFLLPLLTTNIDMEEKVDHRHFLIDPAVLTLYILLSPCGLLRVRPFIGLHMIGKCGSDEPAFVLLLLQQLHGLPDRPFPPFQMAIEIDIIVDILLVVLIRHNLLPKPVPQFPHKILFFAIFLILLDHLSKRTKGLLWVVRRYKVESACGRRNVQEISDHGSIRQHQVKLTFLLRDV